MFHLEMRFYSSKKILLVRGITLLLHLHYFFLYEIYNINSSKL